jgi:hypothetical protein
MYVKFSSNFPLLLDANVYSILSHNLLLYDINEKCLLKIFPWVGLVRRFGDNRRKTKDWKNSLFYIFICWTDGLPVPVTARSAACRLLRLWVRITLGTWMSLCCECCVLSGKGLWDELITLPEELRQKKERQTTDWRQSLVCRQRNVGKNLQGVNLWQVTADHYVILLRPPILICQNYCGSLIYACCRQRNLLPNQQQFGRHWRC